MKKAIVSLYDMSSIMVEPWWRAGYRAYVVDLVHEPGAHKYKNLVTIGGDMRVLKWRLARLRDVAFVAAFPPCTDLAVSGARWFARKRRANPYFQEQAMELVYIARDIAIALDVPWMIENPVSVISTLWRKPNYKFHPWHYSAYAPEDHYTKNTCLWTGNGFRMPELNSLGIEYDIDENRILRHPPSEDRVELRSYTPKGFARAIFEANKPRS